MHTNEVADVVHFHYERPGNNQVVHHYLSWNCEREMHKDWTQPCSCIWVGAPGSLVHRTLVDMLCMNAINKEVERLSAPP